MPKPKSATDSNLPPHWKIRIHIRGSGIIHAISETEPRVHGAGLDWTPITGTEHGDTIGHLDWSDVAAATWRFAPITTTTPTP
jgi:hypothetical protein